MEAAIRGEVVIRTPPDVHELDLSFAAFRDSERRSERAIEASLSPERRPASARRAAEAERDLDTTYAVFRNTALEALSEVRTEEEDPPRNMADSVTQKRPSIFGFRPSVDRAALAPNVKSQGPEEGGFRIPLVRGIHADSMSTEFQGLSGSSK